MAEQKRRVAPPAKGRASSPVTSRFPDDLLELIDSFGNENNLSRSRAIVTLTRLGLGEATKVLAPKLTPHESVNSSEPL